MKNLTHSKIKDVYDSKGYIFKEGIYEMNIFGIRSNSRVSNYFDDWIGAAYVSEIGERVAWLAPATTDPGLYYLKNPINDKGCAAVVPGQYHNSHTLGKHRGEYPAFVQYGPIAVYRDNNRDAVIDADPSSIERGAGFGINIHRASLHGVADLVNNYSAGCQVFKRAEDLDYLLFLADKQVTQTHPAIFTYTLFLEDDFK